MAGSRQVEGDKLLFLGPLVKALNPMKKVLS